MPGRYLGQEEGIHFLWHLEHRGRLDLAVALLDPYGKVMDRTRKEGKKRQPVIFVTEEPHLPKALRGSKKWQSEQVHVTYWAGFRSYRCFIWRPQSESARNSKSKTKQSR